MGAVTEADNDWRRLSDLNEIEKAAVLRFFPSLRNMPMNQFHNLQQDIALVYLGELEQTNQDIGIDQFVLDNPEFAFLIDKEDRAIKTRGATAGITNFILDRQPKNKDNQIKLRKFFQKRIENNETVTIEIRRALQNTRAEFGNEKFNYLKNYEKPKKEK